METFLLSTQGIQCSGKVRRIGVVFFLVETCFECSVGKSHRDVSFEHTEQAS